MVVVCILVRGLLEAGSCSCSTLAHHHAHRIIHLHRMRQHRVTVNGAVQWDLIIIGQVGLGGEQAGVVAGGELGL